MASLNGIDIQISNHLERPLIGFHVRPLKAHKCIAWALRWLKGTDHVKWLREPMYGTPDALFIGNKLIVPPEMFTDINSLIAKQFLVPPHLLGPNAPTFRQ